MTATQGFLLALIVIFSVPYVVWRLLRMDSFAPLAIVQIVGGVVLGPGVFGHLFPGASADLFTPATIASLNAIAQWAVMLFVFLAGVELELSQAWAEKRDAGLTAALALAVPFVFGAGFAALLVSGNAGWAGAAGHPVQVVLGAGMSAAVTALPILVLLLQKLEILRSPFGQRVLRYASLDDLAIWSVLVAILFDWQRLGTQVLFLLALIPLALAYRRLMLRLSEGERWVAVTIWLATCAFVADWSGLHFMVGAFLAGVVTERAWFTEAAFDKTREAVLTLLMPVFFLSTGLRTRFDVGGSAVVLAAFGFLIASVAGKLVGIQIASWFLGWRKGEAWVIGWLLQTKALIMIVFANVLLERQIISADLFTALLLMAVMSTVLTIPVASPALKAMK